MTFFRVKMSLILVSLLTAVLWIHVGYAQTSPITSEVDKTVLSTDETLSLIVKVTGAADLPDPVLPPLDGLFVLERNTSSQISIVDGQTVTVFVHTYELQPTRVGVVTIGAISVSVADETFSTNLIDVEITAGAVVTEPTPSPGTSAPISARLVGQDFFAEAEVDNTSLYIGEQVVHTFRFYRAIEPSGQLVYQGPTFSGFWNPQQPEQRQYDVQAAGRIYKVLELQTVLFPTLARDGTIGATSLTIDGEPSQTFNTDALALKVSHLPQNAPADFSGAVGQFEIEATVEPVSAEADEPVTLRVVISGEGNFDNLPEPEIPDVLQLRALEGTSQIERRFSNGNFIGSRTFEWILVPQANGEFSIPPISYTFFDPVKDRYRTVASEFVNFSVGTGGGENGNAGSQGQSSVSPENIVPDIRDIKQNSISLRTGRRPITGLALFWAAWILPLMFLSAAFVWRMRRLSGQDINAINRNMNVLRDTRRMIGRARRSDGDHFAASGRILTTYIARKLNEPAMSLTSGELVELLRERHVSAELLEKVESSLSVSAGGRFAPGSEVNWFGDRILGDLEILVKDDHVEASAMPRDCDPVFLNMDDRRIRKGGLFDCIWRGSFPNFDTSRYRLKEEVLTRLGWTRSQQEVSA